MNTKQAAHLLYRLGLTGVLLLAFNFGLALGAGKQEKKEDATGLSVAGKDPQAFRDAAALLPTRGAPLPEQEAENLIKELSEKVKAGSLPEDPSGNTLTVLKKLENINLTSSVYTKLKDLARKAGGKVQPCPAADLDAAQPLFREGNELYEKGNVKEAAARYCQALQKCPHYADARNNLALSQMHQGLNLAALFNLEILSAVNPRYTGAGINLSVALERLGFSSKAYEVIKDIASKNRTLPMTQYNLAWFENARGDYGAAYRHIGTACSTYQEYLLARQLKVFNSLEAGNPLNSADLSPLPASLKNQVNRLKSTKVKVTAEQAPVFDGQETMGLVKRWKRFVLAQTKDDWIAVYVPFDGVKHLGWIKKSEVSEVTVSQPKKPLRALPRRP